MAASKATDIWTTLWLLLATEIWPTWQLPLARNIETTQRFNCPTTRKLLQAIGIWKTWEASPGSGYFDNTEASRG
jgi:hypothetical protein